MERKDLLRILQKHPEVIKDRSRLVGALKDYFPGERPQIRLLEDALEIDILRELRTKPLDRPLLLRLRKRLMDEFSLQEDKADWAVRMWSDAYGHGVLGKAMPPPEKLASQPTDLAQPPVKSASPLAKPSPQPVQSQTEQAQRLARILQSMPAPPPAQQRPKSATLRKPTADPIDMSHFELKDNGRVFLYNQESLPWLHRPMTDDDVYSHYSSVYSNRVLMKYKGPGGDVIIPQGVTGIGAWAFSVVPTYKKYKEETMASIHRYLFAPAAEQAPSRPNTVGVRSMTIPKGVTVIGAGAFSKSSALQSITIPQGVTKIGDSAFSYCSSLQSIMIPQGVTQIAYSAFSNCSSLQSITIPRGVTRICCSAFSNCSSLQSITIPQGVTEISDSAFSHCSSLQSITIPQGVTKIGNSAFSYCSSLRSITIPQGVTHIGERAFSGCSSLQDIVLPQGVVLGENVFERCSSLRKRPGGELDTASTNLNHFKFDATCHYLSKYTGPGGDVVIPRGVNAIGNDAFRDCSTLRSVVIPQGITYLGSYAFFGCDNLRSVTIAPGLTKILKSTFGCCPKLKSVTLPSSVREIEASVFPQRGKLILHPITIYAPAGSYAQKYAQENGYRFRPV